MNSTAPSAPKRQPAVIAFTHVPATERNPERQCVVYADGSTYSRERQFTNSWLPWTADGKLPLSNP